jgi:AraC-like DNA-binding protein
MTLILNIEDWDELCQHAPQPQLNNLVLDDFETLEGLPEYFGRGYSRYMELSPGVRLNFSDHEHHKDMVLKIPAHDHAFQIMIFLSGAFESSIHPPFSKARSYFSGSGISPAYEDKYLTGQRLNIVNVEIEPELLESHFLADGHSRSIFQKQLFQGEDWKVSFYPTVTPEMRCLAHQMWNAPYRGAAKRMYLQAKVFELLALHLDLISADPQQKKSAPKLKPKTIASLHYAKDILTKQFEHPPSLPQLARQVEVSERTLQRGFPALFNTTVVGYLIQQRLDRAEMLLRESKYSVAEVATMVGYGHLGNFAKTFKQRFGITPRQCLAGKKSVSES